MSVPGEDVEMLSKYLCFNACIISLKKYYVMSPYLLKLLNSKTNNGLFVVILSTTVQKLPSSRALRTTSDVREKENPTVSFRDYSASI